MPLKQTLSEQPKPDWSFYNPVHIVFKPGALSNLSAFVPFKRVVLTTTAGFTRRGMTDRVRNALGSRLVGVIDDVLPNPDVTAIDAQASRIRSLRPDCILAVGGGSTMDTAKALAKLLAEPVDSSVTRHFRNDEAWATNNALPVITVPTTAGTGSEVTPFATVWDMERQSKHSVSGREIFARTTLLDPELTFAIPASVTIPSGLDAVSHAFESIWNRNATALTTALATQSLQLSLTALPKLHAIPDDQSARSDMMQASLLAGLAISQTRTALAHSISYPLTARYQLPHGIACSFTLPVLLDYNGPFIDKKLRTLALMLGLSSAGDLKHYLLEFFERINMRQFFLDKDITLQDVTSLTGAMYNPSRANNTARRVDADDLQRIVEESAGHIFAGG